MTRIEIKSRVGSDGVLALNVPLGPSDANREVVVTVEPVGGDPEGTTSDQEEWARFIRETAGSWQGEPLVRPEQGEFERREEWG